MGQIPADSGLARDVQSLFYVNGSGGGAHAERTVFGNVGVPVVIGALSPGIDMRGSEIGNLCADSSGQNPPALGVMARMTAHESRDVEASDVTIVGKRQVRRNLQIARMCDFAVGIRAESVSELSTAAGDGISGVPPCGGG
jgi:hypothetical protein